MDHLQVIWLVGQMDQDSICQREQPMDRLQVIWQVVPLSIQRLEWRHNLLKVQVKVVTMTGQHPWTILQMDLLQENQVVQIHYLVKVDQLVDLLQENQADLLRVIQWDLLQAWTWTAMECLHLLQMEWVICILTWMMQEHIKVQKDLLREIQGQCQVICPQICLHLLTIQMMVVR